MSTVQRFKRSPAVGPLAFAVVELLWLCLLLAGADPLLWWVHWLFVACAEVVALPGLRVADRRRWNNFFLVCAAGVWVSLGPGLAWLAWASIVWLLPALLWLGVCGAFVLFVAQIPSARRRPMAPVDAVIVLGAGLVGDRPGSLLEARVRRGMELAVEHGVPLVCSGGQGPDEPVTEAWAMARLARQLSPSVVVRQEDRAVNTRENIAFSVELLGLARRVAVVTSDFHVWRTRRSAQRFSGDVDVVVVGSATPRSIAPAAVVREFIAACAEGIRAQRGG